MNFRTFSSFVTWKSKKKKKTEIFFIYKHLDESLAEIKTKLMELNF